MLLKDGKHIVVPLLPRQGILKTLHRAHSGSTKTYATARQLYYWPNMKKEIEEYIINCQICQADRPTQARPTCEGNNPTHTHFPMLGVGVDPFNAIGKKWLVMVDRYLGYAWLAELNKTCTSKVMGQLKS